MNNIIYLDTETTGVEDTDRLCQLAVKRIGDKEGLQWLFKPPVPISVEAMSITHITNEMVADCITFHDSHVKSDLQKSFLGGDILVAHNAHYDMEILKREGMTLPAKHICTMKVSHFHDKDAELNKNNLQYLRYFYGLKFDEKINPHDAMSDVIVLEKLFEYYLQHYTVEEMVKISARPILLKKMMFGKYKDMWFKDIYAKDKDYLNWCLREMKNMDENLKYTVEYYLTGKHLVNRF